jgi:4-amino-4-deoxy-L-arabinose transferase-like glycosyltransferase
VLVIVLAIAMRLFALFLAYGVPHIGDPANYLRLAEALQAGQGLALPRYEGGPLVPTALYPPALPLLLAGVGSVLPLDALTLCIVNSGIDIAAALLLGRFSGLLGRADLSIPLGLAYLVWPSIALMAPLAYKEGLFIALLLASLVALLQARRGGVRWAVASGTAAGAMILTQPAATPFLPLAFFALMPAFDNGRRWLRVSLIAAAVAMLVMLPWWVRNAITFGTFIPLTSSGGLALWQGAHPAGGMQFQPPPSSWAYISELAAAQLAQSAAWQIILSNPLGYVARCLAKFPASFIMTNWAMDQLVFAKGQPMPELARSPLLRLIPTVAELMAVMLAIIGMFRWPRSIPARLLWASVAQVMIFGIWFEFSERHRAFMVPFVLLMAANLLADNMRRAPPTGQPA